MKHQLKGLRYAGDNKLQNIFSFSFKNNLAVPQGYNILSLTLKHYCYVKENGFLGSIQLSTNFLSTA